MHNIYLKNMNLVTSIFTLLLVFAVSFANADNYEGYKSSIDGIGLWWLGRGDNAIQRLRFGESPEFAIYCDGKNKLFIYEQSTKGYICKTESWRELVEGQWSEHDLSDKKKLLRTIELAKKDENNDAGQSEYYVSLRNLKVDSEGIFTVSKNKLVRGRWVESSPTRDDLEQSKKIALLHIKEVHRENNNSYKSVIGYSNEKIKKLAFRNNAETYTLKLRAGDTEIILLPTLYESEQEGDLISTVVLHEHDSYSFVGHIYGCLLSVGADIDSDGFPEIILENCYSSESQRINYIKIFPEIKNLISYDHN